MDRGQQTEGGQSQDLNPETKDDEDSLLEKQRGLDQVRVRRSRPTKGKCPQEAHEEMERRQQAEEAQSQGPDPEVKVEEDGLLETKKGLDHPQEIDQPGGGRNHPSKIMFPKQAHEAMERT